MRYPDSSDEAWRYIRALRHKPPGHASEGDAKLLFTSATKQSEQFFRLSDQAGHETKPILLYYGLNQASRAIRAVAEEPGSERAWEPRGHGITCPNLDTATELGDIIVKDTRPHNNGLTRGSFQKLAQIAGCPTLGDGVPLRDVWAATPEGATVLLKNSEDVWCCCQIGLSNPTTSMSFEPGSSRRDVLINLTGAPIRFKRELLAANLEVLVHQRYPELRDYTVPSQQDDGRVRQLYAGGWARCWIPLKYKDMLPTLDTSGLLIRIGNRTYRDLSREMWLIPTLGSQTEPTEPVVNWWAILFALSMLARYQPSGWTRMLDVDNSPDATAIEYVLDEAHRVCVNLLADLFRELIQHYEAGML